MKVVILCGGRGTRMERETEYRPKPMIEIGHKPILWHIMNIYASYGFSDFVLCLGYKGDVIRNYFLNYCQLNSALTVNTKSAKVHLYDRDKMPDWDITLVDTGLETMTGARIRRIERFIDGDDFMMTYGDAVANVDIKALVKFHKAHKKTATMTGVFPMYKSRFGELSDRNNAVVNFTEKPINCAALTNGGFFVLKRDVFRYLRDDDRCVFEKDALEKLAVRKELFVYKHNNFWCCMDTPRDLIFLNSLWDNNKAPWISPKQKKPDSEWKAIFDRCY